MTVAISKPALNLRRELARGTEAYQEQKFYFDGLVTNGTFDTDISGWTANRGDISWSSGKIRVSNNSGITSGLATQAFTTEVGKSYQYSIDIGTFNIITQGRFRLSDAAGLGGAAYYESASVAPSQTLTGFFVAQTSATYISFGNFSGTTSTDNWSEFDNVSIYNVDANDDVIHTMPKGWKPKDVFEYGLLQREGSSYDYEVVFDGFDYVVKPTVAPTATTETAVIGVKA